MVSLRLGRVVREPDVHLGDRTLKAQSLKLVKVLEVRRAYVKVGQPSPCLSPEGFSEGTYPVLLRLGRVDSDSSRVVSLSSESVDRDSGVEHAPDRLERALRLDAVADVVVWRA